MTGLIDQVRERLRLKQHSIQTYLDEIKRLIRCLGKRHPKDCRGFLELSGSVHGRTYERLNAEHDAFVRVSLAGMERWIGILKGRLGSRMQNRPFGNSFFFEKRVEFFKGCGGCVVY